MSNRLIGIWKTDLNDLTAFSTFGNVVLEFKKNGDLIYTIIEEGQEQKILMTYEVDNNFLITDQPSSPRKEQSEFFIDTTGMRLEIVFDGRKAQYIRG